MKLAKNITLACLLGMTAVAVPVPAFADDDDHYEHHWRDRDWREDRGDRYYEDGRDYYRERPRYVRNARCRTSGTTGLIVGGALGALLGRQIDRYGDRTPGTIIGAGGGALLGRELDRKRRC